MARRYVMMNKLTRGANPARQLESIEQEFENIYKILRALGIDIDAIDVSGGGAAGGDVFGPSSSIDGEIVLFSGTTGKLLRRASGTGVVKATAGVYSVGLVDLGTEVTGILDASMISGLEHDLLSATHEDTEPDPPIAGALIHGAYTDTGIAWADGVPCAYVPTDDNLGSSKFWLNGLPYIAIGATVRWKRLDPPVSPGALPIYTGSETRWGTLADGAVGGGDIPFSAGDFTAAGATVTVDALTTHRYRRFGVPASVQYTFYLRVQLSAPSNQLRIAWPGGFPATKQTFSMGFFYDVIGGTFEPLVIGASPSAIGVTLERLLFANFAATTVLFLAGQIEYTV